MFKSLQILSFSLLALSASQLHAGMISLPASSFSGGMDVDGDSINDFNFLMDGTEFVELDATFDDFNDPNMFPGATSGYYSATGAATLADLQSTPVWSGTFTAGNLIRKYNNDGVSFETDSVNQVIGIWTMGTLGTQASDGSSLVGYVVDATDYYANPSSGLINIYYNDYGTFSAGGTAEVSLSAAMVPEPSTYALGAGLAMLGFTLYRRRRGKIVAA